MAGVWELDENSLELGLWCPHCRLPSGYRVQLIGLHETGAGPIATLTRCNDCEQPLTGDD